MPTDHIRYDLLAQDALRDMVRKVLADVARTGLKGDHHFNITFRTAAPGVRMPARLREQYPDEMTIVLQYQFWDLKVTADAFEVGLSFGGIPEHLTVPFQAITSFIDPSVQFALQFQTLDEGTGESTAETGAPGVARDARPSAKLRRPARHPPPAPAPSAPTAVVASSSEDVRDKHAAEEKSEEPKGGAEVVRLDRFRKK